MSLCIDKFDKELLDVEHDTTDYDFCRESSVGYLVFNYLQQYCPTQESIRKLVITIDAPSDKYKNNLKIFTTGDREAYLFKIEYINNKHDLIYDLNRRLNEYNLVLVAPNTSEDIIDTTYNYYRIVYTDVWIPKDKLTNTNCNVGMTNKYDWGKMIKNIIYNGILN